MNRKETLDKITAAPCPFCGEQPISLEGRNGFWIECINDKCYVQPHNMELYHVKEDAIDKWNHRFIEEDSKQMLEEYALRFCMQELYHIKLNLTFRSDIVPEVSGPIKKAIEEEIDNMIHQYVKKHYKSGGEENNGL